MLKVIFIQILEKNVKENSDLHSKYVLHQVKTKANG